MRLNVMAWAVGLVAPLLLVLAEPARADFANLMSRIPGEANALVMIDVEKLFKSPLGVKEGWKEKQASAYSDKPLILPPGASRLVMAALVDLSGAASAWEVSLMDVDAAVPVETIAKSEGGYAEMIGDKPAAWSPIGAYFIQLDPKVLGAVTPANRQFATRWAKKKNTLEGAFASEYLKSAGRSTDQGAMFVMALDLEECTSPNKIRATLATEPFESLKGKQFDLTAVAKTVATIKGVTLRVDVGNEITGKGQVDFGVDAAPLAEIGKPLLLEMLAGAGLGLPEFEAWTATVKGKSINLEGKLSTASLRRLASVIQPPTPVEPAEAAAAQQPSGQPTPGKPAPTPPAGQSPSGTPAGGGNSAVAAASLKYYQTVTRILDNLDKEVGVGSKSASLGQSAGWMLRDAKRINRLPILNVDPDLVAWGSESAAALQQAAGVFRVGQIQTSANVAGIYSQTSYDTYNTGVGDTDLMNTNASRRQQAMMQKADSTKAAGDILQGMFASRTRIRAEMTNRYGMEF